MPQTLCWSRKGEIACEQHAPSPGSARWSDEGWQSIPQVKGRRVTYQCQHCGEGSIHHQSRTPDRPPLILNVDDRPASLYARDRMLRRHGFTVANADSGQSALDVARQLLPNLILLDVHLGDIDGRQLCRHVKADADLGHIPVLLISSTLQGATPQDAMRQGHADGFIAEPCDPEVLAGTIRKVLAGAA
jgi:CheY-like chemotaxis protein